MFNKNLIILAIFILNIYLESTVAQCSDIRVYIQTERGSDVPDTYKTCEFEDNRERENWDNHFATAYPNAIQIKLPGEQYSSTRTFNCHAMHGGMLKTMKDFG